MEPGMEPASFHSFVREIVFDKNRGVLNIKQLFKGDVGCVVWDSALVLGAFLQQESSFPSDSFVGKSVIELGAGTGAVGLIACGLGADVTITDLESCLPLMKQNINDNSDLMKGKIEAKVLEWGQSLADFTCSPDFILMADVVYYDEAIPKLVSTVYNLSSSDTIVYMCYEVRTLGNKPQLEKQFFELMSLYFNTTEVPYLELNEQYRSEDIKVFKFVLKA